MSETRLDGGGVNGVGPDTGVPRPAGSRPDAGRKPLRGVRVLVYAVLAAFAVFLAAYAWSNVLRDRAAHLGHLADLGAGGVGQVLDGAGRELMAAVPVGGAAVVGGPIAGRSRTEWVALAVRGPHGRMRRVFGSAPPRVTVRCAAGTVCVAALVPGPAPSGGGRLWLARATGGRTVYGALPLRVLRPVWSQFPAWAADGLYVRGPQGTVVRMWSRARATRAMRIFTWRMVPGTAMAFGVAATADSLRARWWGIVWPEAVFLVVMALVAEGALRTFC